MRRLGEPPVAGTLYRDRPGAYGVILRGQEMLMTVEHVNGGVDLQLPGGGIDAGEAPVQALHREIMEESGWRVSMVRRLGVYQRYCFMPDYDLWARKICRIYLCRAIAKISAPLEDHHDAIWVPIDIAPDMITNPADAAFLASL